MKNQHLFEYRLFSAIFDTQQSNHDVVVVIVTSFSMLLVLLLRDFVPLYYIMPSLVVIGQQIKEKRRGAQCVPLLQPIWYQNTPA